MRFLKDPSKNRFDQEKGLWQLSKIFKWYKKDFGGEKELIAFVRKYKPDLDWVPKKIEYLDYDWALNGPVK